MLRRIISAVFAASLLSLIPSSHATAETPPGFDRVMAAAKRFEELQRAAQAKNTMPRIADPEAGSSGPPKAGSSGPSDGSSDPHEVADLLATLSDADSLFGTATYDGKDAPVLLDVCGKVSQIAMNYMQSGLAAVSDKGDSRDEMTRKSLILEAQNLVTFQAEVVPILAFELRCQARLSHAMADFLSHLPPSEWTDNRRQSLQNTRLGITALVSEKFRVLDARDDSLKPQSKALIASALADTAPTIAEILSVEQRKSIVAMAENITPPAELKPALERLIAAMSRADCEGLCQR